MSMTASDVTAADTAAVGTDAQSIINQVLSDYGLQSLTNWAWDEITSGATSQQVLINMYQTPQFRQRFPGIFERQQKGLPPISPADYVNYEDTLKQYESQYGLPQGSLSDPKVVSEFVGNDVSTQEVQARVQQGYQAVAYAPPEVRQAFTQMFGANGDGALTHYFLDPNRALPLLEQQATAAQLKGTLGMGSINMSAEDAMKLAQQGVTQSQAQTVAGNLEKQAPLYEASINEQQNLHAGQQGTQAEFGLSSQAEQEVLQRQQQRQAEFAGGGSAYSDQHGIAGAGAARPI